MKPRIAALFPNSSRALSDDTSRFMILFLGLIAAGLWSLWFLLVPITRFETSNLARTEVDQAAYPIQAPVSGRILRSHLVLGREVRSGDVLVELGPEAQELQLREEQARLAALSPQIAALKKELTMAEQAREQESQASQIGVAQAQAQLKESYALALYAEQEAERAVRLHSEGLVSERDLMLGKTEADRRRASAESLKLAAARLDQERHQRLKDREAQLDRLRSSSGRRLDFPTFGPSGHGGRFSFHGVNPRLPVWQEDPWGWRWAHGERFFAMPQAFIVRRTFRSFQL